MLARPEPGPDGIDWVADGQAVLRYSELPQAGRAALDQALGSILSDIRRLAESGVAPVLRAAWPAVRQVPDMGHVFAVDGRPVLAAWGAAADGAGGRLARLDDGIPWRAKPPVRWGVYAVAGLAAAALAVLAGVGAPFARDWLVPAPAACSVVPGQLQALGEQSALDTRGAELRTLLATVTEEVGRRRLQCPLPPAPPARAEIAPTPVPAPPVPEPPVTPPSTLPPRAALPQEDWDRRDLAVLEGCWNLDSGLRIGPVSVRSWRLCFNRAGSGEQNLQLEDQRRCRGPLVAAFSPDQSLRVTLPAPCAGEGLRTQYAELRCRRVSDTEARCEGRNSGADGNIFNGRFRR